MNQGSRKTGVVAKIPSGGKRGIVVDKNGTTEYQLDSDAGAGLVLGAEVTFAARAPIDFRDVPDVRDVQATGFEVDVRKANGKWVVTNRRQSEVEEPKAPQAGITDRQAELVGVVVAIDCTVSSVAGWIQLKDGQRARFTQADRGSGASRQFHLGDEVTCHTHPRPVPENVSRRQRPSYEPGGSRFLLIATDVVPTGFVRLAAGIRIPRAEATINKWGRYGRSPR